MTTTPDEPGMSPLTEEQLTALTAPDLAALRDAAEAEQVRRWEIEHIPIEVEDLNRRYNRAKGKSRANDWPELPAAVDAFKNRNNK